MKKIQGLFLVGVFFVMCFCVPKVSLGQECVDITEIQKNAYNVLSKLYAYDANGDRIGYVSQGILSEMKGAQALGCWFFIDDPTYNRYWVKLETDSVYRYWGDPEQRQTIKFPLSFQWESADDVKELLLNNFREQP